MKLVSICIPTYNRSAFLEQSLTAIVHAIPTALQAQVEIVISNNCSTDNTVEVINSFQQNFPQLIWNVVQQASNIGSINVVVAAKYATGKFIWIISDDDIIHPESVNQIVQVLSKKSEAKSLILEYSTFSETQTAMKIPLLIAKDQLLSADEALSVLSTNITFLSILVFENTNLQITRAIEHSSHLPQCYLFADQLRQGQVAWLSGASIFVRENNSGGYNFFQVFVTQFNDLMTYCLSLGFAQSTIAAVKTKHLWYLYKFSIILKSQNYGTFTLDSKDAIHRIQAAYPNHWLASTVVLVLQIPDPFLRSLQNTFQKTLTIFKKPSSQSAKLP